MARLTVASRFGPDGGPPIPIKIQPADFHAVAQRFVDAAATLHVALPTLFRVLAGFRGPAGVDRSAKRFDAAYRPAVAGVVDGVNRAVTLLDDIGLGIDLAAFNHWNADAMATPHGAPPPPWSPVDTGLLLAQSFVAPSLVGSPEEVLPEPLADLVPMGHIEDLHTVAQAFLAVRDTVEDISAGLHNALEFLFSNNRSADLDALDRFWDRVGGSADSAILTALQRACDRIATSIVDYANWTVDTQNQILDAVGDVLKNIALGAVVGIFLGMFSEGLGSLAAVLRAADEVGEGGALVAAIDAAVTIADGRLAAVGATMGGVAGAMATAIESTPSPNIGPADARSVTDTQAEQAAEDLANKAQPDPGLHTEPSRVPDPNATPRGNVTRIGAKEAPSKKLGLQRENESADILAKAGYDVEQNPKVPGRKLPGTKNPDYRIEGRIFDNYAPTTGNIRNIASTIEGKVVKGQADRIILNLTDSPISSKELLTQLREHLIAGLKEVKVIDADGDVIDLYP